MHDLWIDASVSFPDCITDLSSMVFRVYVTSPYQASLLIAIGQRYSSGPYDIYCYSHVDDPPTYPLYCANDGSSGRGESITVTSYR